MKSVFVIYEHWCDLAGDGGDLLVSDSAFSDLVGVEKYFEDNYSFEIIREEIGPNRWCPDTLVAKYTGKDESEADWPVTYWFEVYKLPVSGQ